MENGLERERTDARCLRPQNETVAKAGGGDGGSEEASDGNWN